MGLDVWYLIGPVVFFHESCANSKGSGETARKLAWAFAGRKCDKFLNLMSVCLFLEACEVVDCADKIPGFMTRPGLNTWRVCRHSAATG